MKKNIPVFIIVLFISLGIAFMGYEQKKMDNENSLEVNRQEVIRLLQENLQDIDPVLFAFVDDDYKSVIASKINSNGTCIFDRGLAKNKDPFGNYYVKYDLKNMKLISKELDVTNPKYIEQWQAFKEKN